MILVEKLQQYKKLWECPKLFILTPMPDYIDRGKIYGEAPYFVMETIGTQYGLWMIESDVAPIVINKMIQAGVTIWDKIPDESDMKDEVMWGKRKNEFVLISLNPPIHEIKYLIRHKISHNPLNPRAEFIKAYSEVCEKMIEAGVEVWSKEQWNEFEDATSSTLCK